MSNFSALKTAIQNAIKQNGNEEITGNLLQNILLSIVETLGDSAINTLETGLSNEASTRGNADTQLNNLITGVKNNVDNGYVYAGIATPSTTPVSGKVFYIALQAGTYTNFGSQVVLGGITILKYNGSAWSKEQVLYTDGGVFDISAYNATGGELAKYANLTAALGTSGANIPQAIRKGGMSVKFVQTDDNKYVQYRLTSNTFTTTETAWQKQGVEVSVAQNTLMIGEKPFCANNGEYSILYQSLVRKTISADGSQNASTNRLMTGIGIVVSKGTVVKFTAGTKINQYFVRLFAPDNVSSELFNTGWINSNTTMMPYDGVLFIMFSNTDSREIEPLDYDANIYLVNIDETLSFDGLNPVRGNVIAKGLRLFFESKENIVLNAVLLPDKIQYSSKRILTGFIQFPSSQTITANSGYKFTIRVYDDLLNLRTTIEKVTSYTVSSSERLYVLEIMKSDETQDISYALFSNAISINLTGCHYYISGWYVDYILTQIKILDKIDTAPRLNSPYFVTSGGILNNLGYYLEFPYIIAFNARYNLNGSKSTFIFDNNRLTTCLCRFSSGQTLTTNSGYQMRVSQLDMALGYVTQSSYANSYTVTDLSKYYIITIVKTDLNASISVNELGTALNIDTASCKFFILGAYIELLANKLNSINEPSQERYNLNRNLTSLTDMVWEYQNWVFPQVQSYNGVRNNLYFAFTNESGFSGIAQYNFDSAEVTKTFLKKNTEADDHNLIACLMMSNNKIITAFSGGHNTDNLVIVRVSDAKESIENFGEAIILTSKGLTSYAQLFEYDGKIYMFNRLWINNDLKWYWAYRISNDYGKTWSEEVLLIESPLQYYCQFNETTTNGVLRIVMYSNPALAQPDTRIREGFLHLDTMTLYSNDNLTALGTANVSYTSFPVIVDVVTGKLNRLYNSTKTAISDTKVLFARFSDEYDGEYYIYDNGNVYKLIDSGDALYHTSRAQLGIAFIGTSQIAIAREDDGTDYIEIYDYSNGAITLNKTVASHSNEFNYRTARPMIDNNQRALVYIQGIFEPSTYTNFKMDGHIYLLE